MAFCFKATQDGYCHGDPLKIKRLRVRFAKPVLPLDTVTTRGWLEEKKGGIAVLGLEAVNQKGAIVLRNGLAEVAV
jgi:acyl dehydratase